MHECDVEAGLDAAEVGELAVEDGCLAGGGVEEFVEGRDYF